MATISTNEIDKVLVQVGRAKKVFIYSSLLEDHVRVLKGEFQEQLADMAREDPHFIREMRIELDEFGDLWVD